MPGCRSGTGLMLRASDWFLPGTRILRCIDGYYHVLRSTMWNLSDIHCIYITDLAIHIYSLGLVNGGLPALPLWAGAVLELTRLCFCQTGSCLALACYEVQWLNVIFCAVIAYWSYKILPDMNVMIIPITSGPDDGFAPFGWYAILWIKDDLM